MSAGYRMCRKSLSVPGVPTVFSPMEDPYSYADGTDKSYLMADSLSSQQEYALDDWSTPFATLDRTAAQPAFYNNSSSAQAARRLRLPQPRAVGLVYLELPDLAARAQFAHAVAV